MRMNDTLAATVAAVVPVLWLVAVVEVHQYQRRLFPVEWPGDERLVRIAEIVRSPQGGATPEILSEARLILEDAKMHVPKGKKVLDRFVLRYEIVSVVLMLIEAMSLLWLLGWHDAPEVFGWVCVGGTLLGFLCVLRLPLSATGEEALYAVSERARHLREIGEFLGRHSGGDGSDS
ncbi:hypothetical protein ACFXHD_10835 [Streptomyces hydrogenans]|uniref:hypothetical protein n=1 Tax=Streptomyces hydrogenans TaxID=1873719 RepID=UPI0036C45AC4